MILFCILSKLVNFFIHLTVSNEHQTGCALCFAIHQVEGERSLISDLQRVHEHFNDAGRLIKVHRVFLDRKRKKKCE